MVDEQGEEFPVVYLARKRGMSGGWKGFAEFHELVDGDCVIFQLLSRSVLKVTCYTSLQFQSFIAHIVLIES